jgi:Uma2 family endonuclease
MTIMTHHATIADLEQHPGRCELINGEVIEMAPVGLEHGLYAGDAFALLQAWARARPYRVLVGDVGFIWSQDTVRAPDVAVIRAADAEQAPRRGFLPFPPVLAVEVISPSDAWSDVQEKAAGWLVHGAALVWLVDPRQRCVEVWTTGELVRRLDLHATVDGGDVLPGFSAPVAAFFE